MDLSLGTAQFGMAYGATNDFPPPSLGDVGEILEFALANNIRHLDTAASYGDSEKILGEIGVSNFVITTKLPHIGNSPIVATNWVDLQIEESLKRLRLDTLSTVLFHNCDDLLGANGDLLWSELSAIKAAGTISKIGVSVYDEIELAKVLQLYKIDVVQVPCNILDDRFRRSDLLSTLTHKNIEIQVRSIFLQGVLIAEPSTRPQYFQQFREYLDPWDTWIAQNKLDARSACFSSVDQLGCADLALIGVGSKRHLSGLLDARQTTVNLDKDFSCTELRLIDPRLWKL
jgi:aryl-alcohol dehydrogenase-like predicted oxidoreductase